ncbi:MAG: hypothetical protein SGJ13_12985 [Actinomycetota bacterium]|nr:hypothetical protein [Actinomycetota bacterium]
MSPKTRYQAPRRRERSEVLKAVAAVAVVVVVTALLVWLLRPGPSDRFDGGGGGLFNRQPRASWLVALTVGALVVFVWYALTRVRRRRNLVLVVGCVGILGVAVLAGTLWPDGLLHTYIGIPDQSDFDDLTPETTTVPGSDVTITVPGLDVTVPPGTETTAAPTDTAPTETAPGETPTTGSP